MTYSELERLLKKNGWYYYDSVGLYIQYKHNKLPGKITVPKHRGDIKKKALNAILRQMNFENMNLGGKI